MNSLSFRAKLFICFAAVTLAGLALPALYVRQALHGDILAESSRAALRQAELTRALLEGQKWREINDLQAYLAGLGRRLSVRLTYIDRAGRVLADSDVPASRLTDLDNHSDRPEVLAALSSDTGLSVRHSATLDTDLIYAAARVSGGPDRPEGVIRLALPFSGVKGRLDEAVGRFTLVLALAVAVALLLAYALTRRLERSLSEMFKVVEGIAAGDYRQRLHLSPGREFAALAGAVNTMAGRIEDHVATIAEQKAELESVLEAMREGVLVLGRRGRIRRVNAALARIFPGADQALGRLPVEAIPSPELQKAFDRLLFPGPEAPETLHVQIEPDRDRIFHVQLVRPREADPAIGAVAVFHDVSELTRLERVRRDFVANVSHELRTPLTVIKGYAETLLDNPAADPAKGRGFLETIRKNADHMARMVEDLLSLARLESGRQNLELAAVDPAEALAVALRACATLAEAKGMQARPELPPGLKVMADPHHLAQVFRNLLENAFKYGPPGSLVTVGAAPRPEGVEFAVVDQGPGVPREDRARIFERFYRVEKHRARDGGASPSTGLGLAICKHIVERHGGRIWVESPAPGNPEGLGSAFCFILPAAA